MSVLYANTPFIKGELPALLSEYLSSVWLCHLHLNGAFIDQEADRLWHFSGKLKNRTEENQQVREWLEKTMLTVVTISPGMTTLPNPYPQSHPPHPVFLKAFVRPYFLRCPSSCESVHGVFSDLCVAIPVLILIPNTLFFFPTLTIFLYLRLHFTSSFLFHHSTLNNPDKLGWCFAKSFVERESTFLKINSCSFCDTHHPCHQHLSSEDFHSYLGGLRWRTLCCSKVMSEQQP